MTLSWLNCQTDTTEVCLWTLFAPLPHCFSQWLLWQTLTSYGICANRTCLSHWSIPIHNIKAYPSACSFIFVFCRIAVMLNQKLLLRIPEPFLFLFLASPGKRAFSLVVWLLFRLAVCTNYGGVGLMCPFGLLVPEVFNSCMITEHVVVYCH